MKSQQKIPDKIHDIRPKTLPPSAGNRVARAGNRFASDGVQVASEGNIRAGELRTRGRGNAAAGTRVARRKKTLLRAATKYYYANFTGNLIVFLESHP